MSDLYKTLCEYRDIVQQEVDIFKDIATEGDTLHGKWLAYSDCLNMLNGIIEMYKEKEEGENQ